MYSNVSLLSFPGLKGLKQLASLSSTCWKSPWLLSGDFRLSCYADKFCSALSHTKFSSISAKHNRMATVSSDPTDVISRDSFVLDVICLVRFQTFQLIVCKLNSKLSNEDLSVFEKPLFSHIPSLFISLLLMFTPGVINENLQMDISWSVNVWSILDVCANILFTNVVIFSLVMTFKWVNVNTVWNDYDFHMKCFSFSLAETVFNIGVERFISSVIIVEVASFKLDRMFLLARCSTQETKLLNYTSSYNIKNTEWYSE